MNILEVVFLKLIYNYLSKKWSYFETSGNQSRVFVMGRSCIYKYSLHIILLLIDFKVQKSAVGFWYTALAIVFSTRYARYIKACFSNVLKASAVIWHICIQSTTG